MSGYFGDRKIVDGYFRASNGQLYRVLEGYFGDKLIYRKQGPAPSKEPITPLVTPFEDVTKAKTYNTNIKWNAGLGGDGNGPTYYIIADRYVNLSNKIGPSNEQMWGTISKQTDETIRVKNSVTGAIEEWTLIGFYIQAWCQGIDLEEIVIHVTTEAKFALDSSGKFILGKSVAELKSKYGN